MLCGYSKSLINPPVGIAICGSYDVKRSEGRIDDLYARAIAFSDGEKKCVIVSVDVCYMHDEEFEYTRRTISERAGIDYDAVIIVCTHTHAGGHNGSAATISSAATEDDLAKIAEYTRIMTEGVISSAVAALEDLKPAKIYFAADTVEGVSNIRRYRMKDGSVVTNPGRHNPDIAHALGEPNNTMKLIKIEREGAKDVYLVNFGMHATSVGWRTYLSSDYPGVVCRTIEAALDVECAFLQGAAGDVVQINAFPTPEIEKILEADKADRAKNKLMATYIGHKIAGTVLRIHNTAEQIPEEELKVGIAPMKVPANKAGGDIEEAKKICALQSEGRHHELPYKGMALVTVVANAARIIRMQDEPDFYEYNLYAVSLGEIAFCCLPSEPFCDLGRGVEMVSPIKNTLVLSLANRMTTYFPTTKAYSEGGYEVATTSVGPGTEEIIVDTAGKLLGKLKK